MTKIVSRHRSVPLQKYGRLKAKSESIYDFAKKHPIDKT